MLVVRLLTTAVVLTIPLVVFGQADAPDNAPIPLCVLLAEANANNPQISAADQGWKAAKEVPREVSSLPDPTFTFQQFSVGSPKPFAGYTNSDFAYVAIGASQELPYPGKLRLRGEAAQRAADVRGAELDATRASIADTVKSDYLKLAYLQMTLGILQENEGVLEQIIHNATAHYEVGQGSQADVLQAQVERTKVLREITLHREQTAEVEAQLKGMLNWAQDSPDIVTVPLTETTLQMTSAALLQLVRAHNPEVQVDANSVRQGNAALKSAKREGKPDFNVAYMYQNTDGKYRDYYMFSLNVRLPRRGRTRAEIAEAADKLAQAQSTLDAHLQQQLAEVKQEYVTATSDAELLKEYREGMIPLSDAAYRSTLNAYASNREALLDVLRAITNVLQLKLDYAQTLADHETALAHLETLTGATLR